MASRGVNKVILVGNVGNDPEVRYMPNGNAVANVSVATSDSWKDRNTGDQQERTEWHRVVFFNRLAEIVEQYVKKGTKLYLEGRLQTRSWEQDGAKRYSTEIIANDPHDWCLWSVGTTVRESFIWKTNASLMCLQC